MARVDCAPRSGQEGREAAVNARVALTLSAREHAAGMPLLRKIDCVMIRADDLAAARTGEFI